MRNKGFTLVELLVVIVIIGILAAAAISVFGGGTDKAKENTMQSDVAAMHSAGVLALADQGYDSTRNVTNLANQGYLSEVPINPFFSTDSTAWYAYASTKIVTGTSTNPVIYAAGINSDDVIYDKGTGLSITSPDATDAAAQLVAQSAEADDVWQGTAPAAQ